MGAAGRIGEGGGASDQPGARGAGGWGRTPGRRGRWSASHPPAAGGASAQGAPGTSRLNSGSSSRKRTPWRARLTSPGLGIDGEGEPITTAERNRDGGVLEATPRLTAG